MAFLPCAEACPAVQGASAASSARGAAAPSTCPPRSPAATRSRDACSPRRRAARRSRARRRAASSSAVSKSIAGRAICGGAGSVSKMSSPSRSRCRRTVVGAEAFDHDVDREPVQPGGERRVAAKGAELLPERGRRRPGSARRRRGRRSSAGRGCARAAGACDRRARTRARLPPRRSATSSVGTCRQRPDRRRPVRTAALMPSQAPFLTPAWTEPAAAKGWKRASAGYRRGRSGCLPTSVSRRSAGRPRSADGACFSGRCP